MRFDFRALLGGRQFLVSIELGRNGSFIKTLSHIDGGANIFGAIKTSLAFHLSKSFNIHFIKLPKPIVPTGYNGQSGSPITVALLLTLMIDGRRINFPFLVTDLGHTDVLIGRKFLEHYDIKQVYTKGKNCLEWPADMAIQQYFDKRILLPTTPPKSPILREHQQDAERRDALLEADEYRRSQAKLASISPELQVDNQIDTSSRSVLPHPRLVSNSPARRGTSNSTYSRPSGFSRDLRKRLARMEDALLDRDSDFLTLSDPEPSPTRARRPGFVPYRIDIAPISSIAMTHFYLGRKKSRSRRLPNADVFVASLNDFDSEVNRRAIERKELLSVELAAVDGSLSPQEALEARYRADEDLVKTKLPAQYQEFVPLFSRRDSDVLAERRPGIDHKIELTGPNTLTFEPLRKMTDEQLTEAKRYIVDHLHKGFIAPSNAPHAAPILFAKKEDGSLRFCVDFRKLNELTKKDPYPLPLIDEMMARICKAKIFTKIDIQQAFHRVRIHQDSEDLVSFRSRYGTFKYRVMPFGLTNAPATFQRFINDILMEYLDVFCSAYMDDILIYSESVAEHEIHVKKVMGILQANNLQADIKKSEFNVTKTKFLGFNVGVDGIEVNPEKVAVIKTWQYANNVRGIQSYLGFCNFYRRFIEGYSRIAAPLVRLTAKETPFRFDDNCRKAWETLREALLSAPVLKHYDPYKETRLETDSSDGVVAGVLSQKHGDGLFHPVGYFSKTMGDAELNYPIHDKELLAIFRSFQQYKPELLGAQKSVHVYTDHKALEYFMTTKDLTARQARWAEFFADFHFMIMYRTGVTNTVADTLSRREQDITPLVARKRAIRSQQLLPNDKIDPRILEEVTVSSLTTCVHCDPIVQVVEKVELSPVALVEREKDPN